jgi:WhiB family redox-sensing transcriptional regulator
MKVTVLHEYDHENDRDNERDNEDWKAAGVCASEHDVDFFPTTDDLGAITQALALCGVCPVQDECLAFAIETNQTDGIWGGATPSERTKLRRMWLRDLRAAS